MRKIFTSPRLENVEAVARLLQAEGIEVRVEHGRALHRAIRGHFSYLDAGKAKTPQPEVWVIRSDDQPRARALMREAGLLQDTTRTNGPPQLFAPTSRAPEPGKKHISRLRYGLLALVLVVVAVNFMRRPADTPSNAERTAPAPARSQLTMLDESLIHDQQAHVIATPPLLAAMLAQRLLAAHPADTLCLAIDGQDPPAAALAAATQDSALLVAASACPAGHTRHVDVHRYTTDGSGTGSVRVTQRHQNAQVTVETVELRVRRSGEVWTVLDSDGHPHFAGDR